MGEIAFFGGGRVTRILLKGWQRAGALPPNVVIHEPNDEAFARIEAFAPSPRRVTLEEAASADVLFLALHPPAISPVLSVIKAGMKGPALLVSLAPKVTLAALSTDSGTLRVARMIPNAPSCIGQGYNPVVFGPGLDSAARAELAALVAPWGQAPEVEEVELEAYAILTGMGPTYLWFQWETLREIARELGLASEAVDRALHAMVTGSLATLLDSGLPPGEVMDLVPFKPLAGSEAAILAAYREALPALHAKIRSAAAATR